MPRASEGLDTSCLAFAGIARPQRFFCALEAANIDVRTTRVFPDHHWYSERDLASLGKIATGAGALALVTTEKDAIRLPNLEQAHSPPIHVWSYRLSWARADEFEAWLLRRIGANPVGRR